MPKKPKKHPRAQLQRFESPIVAKLPDEIAAGIGHVFVRWAYLEWTLKLMIYNLVGVDETVGRVVIGTGRSEDQVNKIEDLMTILGILPEPPLTSLKNALVKLEKSRDALAHGLWVKDPETGGLCIQDIGGKWNVGTKTPRVTKRMYPDIEPISKETLDKLLANIEAVIANVESLHANALAARSALQETLRGQAAQDRRTGDQSQSTPQDPQAPFPK